MNGYKTYALVLSVDANKAYEFKNGEMSNEDAFEYVYKKSFIDNDVHSPEGCWELHEFSDYLNDLTDDFLYYVLFVSVSEDFVAKVKRDTQEKFNFYKTEFQRQTITETCAYCESENELQWDVSKNGWLYHCPTCGERQHCCDLCFHASDNPTHKCDHSDETGLCWRDVEYKYVEYENMKGGI